MQTSAGIFTYKVNGTRIVHKDDKTVIVPTNHAVLTLTTCYPFNVIGNAPDRYIVSADLNINKKMKIASPLKGRGYFHYFLYLILYQLLYNLLTRIVKIPFLSLYIKGCEQKVI